MNSLKKFFLLMLLMSLALLSHGSTLYRSDELSHEEEDEYEADTDDTLEAVDEDSFPLRGIGRLLAQKTHSRVPALATCDRYPKVCRVKGSPGRNCCAKRCVDRKTDRLNCGKCGRKCKYGEICCKGKCVNPMNDKKHCGGCNNKCRQRKGKCVYGMCSYA